MPIEILLSIGSGAEKKNAEVQNLLRRASAQRRGQERRGKVKEEPLGGVGVENMSTGKHSQTNNIPRCAILSNSHTFSGFF